MNGRLGRAAARLLMIRPGRYLPVRFDIATSESCRRQSATLFEDKDHDVVGFVKHFLFRHVTGNVEGQTREKAAELLRQNKISFLFGNDGKVIDTGRQPDKRASIGSWS
jgi:hypothetical protein